MAAVARLSEVFALNYSDCSRPRIFLTLTPGMLRWNGLWMRLQEMMQNMKQSQNMFLVATDLALPNILHNHVPNPFGAMFLGQEILRERSSGNFWKMLILTDGEHFLFGQAA
jgi:hypothetical protein